MCFLSTIGKVADTLPHTDSALLLHVLSLASSQRRWLYMHTWTSANTQTTETSALKDHLFPARSQAETLESGVSSSCLPTFPAFPSCSSLSRTCSWNLWNTLIVYRSSKLIGVRITSCFWDSNSDRLVNMWMLFYVIFLSALIKAVTILSLQPVFSFSHIWPQLYHRGWKDNCVSGQGTGRSCEPSLQHQKNVLNSNDAASPSACDSERAQTWWGESKVKLEMTKGGKAADKNDSEKRISETCTIGAKA